MRGNRFVPAFVEGIDRARCFRNAWKTGLMTTIPFPFPDEDAATSCLRDGATRAGLQSDPGHQHHGHSAAHGRDEGLAKPEKRLLNATRPRLLRFDTSGKAFLHNQGH